MGFVLSERDARRIQDAVRWVEQNKGIFPILRGFRNFQGGGGTSIKIFEVQSAATGDGVYNCYEQKLLNAEWDDTAGDDRFDNKESTPEEVEVLNLLENDCEATYARALAKYDLIEAFKFTDDDAETRWVGIPIVESPRRARTNQAAPAQIYITCNLIDRNGNEITEGLGYNITVYADICGGGNLNEAVPRLADNDYVWVVNRQGKWYFDYNFNASESCVCSVP